MPPLATDLAGPALSGLVAGWGVAVPLGAIGVLLVDLGMRAGLRRASAAAAAVATADLLYAGVAAAAGSAAAALLEPHQRALRLAAAAVLAAVAVMSLRGARRRARAGTGAVPPPARLYARFLGLTAVNPTTVVYFAALIAGLPAVASAPADAKAVFVAAVGVASLSWQLVLAASGAALHHRLPEHARLWTAVAGNALVLALAVRMALSA
jgi:threonine/homoserine/homoserine lactone efflux protein